MELIGEMYSSETDATQSEIEHGLKLNTRVPSEFDNKPLAFWQCHEESLPILSKLQSC